MLCGIMQCAEVCDVCLHIYMHTCTGISIITVYFRLSILSIVSTHMDMCTVCIITCNLTMLPDQQIQKSISF